MEGPRERLKVEFIFHFSSRVGDWKVQGKNGRSKGREEPKNIHTHNLFDSMISNDIGFYLQMEESQHKMV